MSVRQDAQWWAGALAAACIGLMGAAVVPHPYDKAVMGLAAACGSFALYRVTPPDAVKKE